MQGEVVVKGWRNGLLLIVPPDGAWEAIIEQVHAKLDEAKARSFWRGAQTTLDCGMRAVSLHELDALLERIKRGFGLVPVGIVAMDADTRAAGEKLALVSYTELPLIKKPSRPFELERPERVEQEVPASVAVAAPVAPVVTAPSPTGAVSNALYVPGLVRNGQRIEHDGNLVIMGDVNAGAEVVADGDIVIFGVLRGLAHAGYRGNESARIVALRLSPPQLRIAGKIARSPEEEKAPRGNPASTSRTPEVARIENGEIQVFPL